MRAAKGHAKHRRMWCRVGCEKLVLSILLSESTMRAAMVARSVGATHAGRVAISEHCQLPHLNRQCEQQKVTRSAAPVAPRGLRKASVVNFTIRIDNASSKRSRGAPQNVVPRGLRKASVVNFTIRIDNASSKRSREAPQNVVPRGLRKASVVNYHT